MKLFLIHGGCVKRPFVLREKPFVFRKEKENDQNRNSVTEYLERVGLAGQEDQKASELSRDHLVIMVTHNYEQMEPYVTS